MNLVLSVALMTLCGSLGALFFKRGAANVSGLRSLLPRRGSGWADAATSPARR